MINTIIITVKTLLRRPSTWVWGALFPIALSTMFMFMFANLSSDGKVDPVPVAVVADEAWDASTFKDVATSLAKEGDDQLLKIHECDDAAEANHALKSGEVAGVYTVDDAGAPKLTLLSSYDSSRASTVLTDRSILETVASSYTQNAELMRQIAQDNPAALADPEAVARALSLKGGTRRVSLTRTTPDGTTIYYYALFGLVAMMSSEFAALAVVDLQPNLSGLGARRCVGGVSKTASLAGIFVGSWLVSFASMAIAIGYVRLLVCASLILKPSCFASTLAGARGCAWRAAPHLRLLPRAWGFLWGRFPLRAARRPNRASSRALPPRAPCSPDSTASRRWRLPTMLPAPVRPSAGSTPSSSSAICSTACISLRIWVPLSFAPVRLSSWPWCLSPPLR